MSAPTYDVAPRGVAATSTEAARGASLALPRTARAVATAGLTVIVGILLLLPAGAAVQVVLSAQLDDHTPTQAIVVLDPARYWGDPAPVLRARLTHAAELYREGVAPVVILTGPDRMAGADRFALMSHGVPAQDIITFDTGADTVGSLRVVAGVMHDLGWSAATVVTDPAHAARAQATATAYGIDAHLSPTDRGPGTAMTSEYVGRETLALLRYHLFSRWSIPQLIH